MHVQRRQFGAHEAGIVAQVRGTGARGDREALAIREARVVERALAVHFEVRAASVRTRDGGPARPHWKSIIANVLRLRLNAGKFMER